LVLLALATSACSKHEPERDCPPPADSAKVVDPNLLAFLSLARSAHHKADIKEEAQDLAGAVSELGAVLRKLPGGSEQAPEIREVVADTRARLADLKSRQGSFDAAAEDLRAGLEQMREPNYFRGHLFEVQGANEERRAKALEAAGKSAEAKSAKARALEAFEEAMKIQAGVIDKLGPGPEPPTKQPHQAP
jgi:tetratricopeptide (TPR) repeat protein